MSKLLESNEPIIIYPYPEESPTGQKDPRVVTYDEGVLTPMTRRVFVDIVYGLPAQLTVAFTKSSRTLLQRITVAGQVMTAGAGNDYTAAWNDTGTTLYVKFHPAHCVGSPVPATIRLEVLQVDPPDAKPETPSAA